VKQKQFLIQTHKLILIQRLTAIASEDHDAIRIVRAANAAKSSFTVLTSLVETGSVGLFPFFRSQSDRSIILLQNAAW
jgi:hypothetical protein